MPVNPSQHDGRAMPPLTRARSATAANLVAMAALIASAGLPPVFIAEHLDGFLIAGRGGALRACGGVEAYRNCAVLRSIVVAYQVISNNRSGDACAGIHAMWRAA